MTNRTMVIIATCLSLFLTHAYAKDEMGIENENAFRLFMFSQMLNAAALTCSSEISDWGKEYPDAFSKWTKLNAQGLKQGEIEVHNFYAETIKNGKTDSTYDSFEELKARPANIEKDKLALIRKHPDQLKKYCDELGELLSKPEPIQI